jgi:hypothetical protein
MQTEAMPEFEKRFHELVRLAAETPNPAQRREHLNKAWNIAKEEAHEATAVPSDPLNELKRDCILQLRWLEILWVNPDVIYSATLSIPLWGMWRRMWDLAKAGIGPKPPLKPEPIGVLGSSQREKEEVITRAQNETKKVLRWCEQAADDKRRNQLPPTIRRRTATERRNSQGGKRRLEVSNPIKFQIYQRIQQVHQPPDTYADTIDRLKADRQFTEQIRDIGLRLNSTLVKNALAFFDQRRRDQARNKQETNRG